MDRIKQGLTHVSALPTLAGEAEVLVTPMDKAHADWWHSYIQPEIRANYVGKRADVDWEWPILRALAATEAVGKAPRTVSALSLLLVDRREDEPRVLPCGLTLLVLGEAHLPDKRKKSVYVWYLADAPRNEFSRVTGIPQEDVPRPIASALIDVALAESFTRQQKGRAGLHADPVGGARLAQWYTEQVGMTPLPAKKTLPPTIALAEESDNDGRFFYFNTPEAVTTSARFDTYRR